MSYLSVCNLFWISMVLVYPIKKVDSSRLRLSTTSIYGMQLVEVYHSGEWGTICDDCTTFISVGRVICRQLGYWKLGNISSPEIPFRRYDIGGNLTHRIWLDNLVCSGNESDIEQCQHARWGIHNCAHSEDIYVKCSSCYVQHCRANKSVCRKNGTVCLECIPPYVIDGLNSGCRMPVCFPECQNNGTCIADDTCRCEPGFRGKVCELGNTLDELLKPHLNVAEPNILSPLAWYDNPEISSDNNLCFVKIGIKNASHDTVVSASSFNMEGHLFGNYSMGPIDTNSTVIGPERVACLQVRCPAFSANGTGVHTRVRITASSNSGTYHISPKHFNMQNITVHRVPDGSEELQFTLEPGNNYGPRFGVYTSQGYREKAKYIAEQRCFCGRNYIFYGINPSINTLAKYVCDLS